MTARTGHPFAHEEIFRAASPLMKEVAVHLRETDAALNAAEAIEQARNIVSRCPVLASAVKHGTVTARRHFLGHHDVA